MTAFESARPHNESRKKIRVAKLIAHKDFGVLGNDIALLRLGKLSSVL